MSVHTLQVCVRSSTSTLQLTYREVEAPGCSACRKWACCHGRQGWLRILYHRPLAPPSLIGQPTYYFRCKDRPPSWLALANPLRNPRRTSHERQGWWLRTYDEVASPETSFALLLPLSAFCKRCTHPVHGAPIYRCTDPPSCHPLINGNNSAHPSILQNRNDGRWNCPYQGDSCCEDTSCRPCTRVKPAISAIQCTPPGKKNCQWSEAACARIGSAAKTPIDPSADGCGRSFDVN
jgi:hypothetical protein